MNAAVGGVRKQHSEPCRLRLPPHVDVKRLGDVDLEASGPGTVGCVHESDTQQLVVVVTGPVEDHAGAWQGGDVALRIGCALTQMRLSELTPLTVVFGWLIIIRQYRINDGHARMDFNGND